MLSKLKKIDQLVLKSYLGPYLLSFFIAQFVLVMQFLWKHIDDILGKGFSILDLLELISYFAVTQIPMALPIAILLSSVMVMGNMSEQYELSSMKSAGVSLIRVMRSSIILAIATAVLSLFASNYLKPSAQLQFKKRMLAIKSQKPSLALEEKIFNRDFTGYAIRINEKGKDDESIHDVYIYDHTMNDKTLMNLTKAESGRMYNDSEGGLFIMELENGTSYREMKRSSKKNEDGKKYPFMRTDFKEWKKVFDMSEFDTDDESTVNISGRKEDMLNAFQLIEAIDSANLDMDILVKSVIEDEKKESERIEELEGIKNRNNNRKDAEEEADSTVVTKSEKDNRTRGEIAAALKNAAPAKKYASVGLNKIVIQKQTDTLSVYENWYSTISDLDKNNLHIKAVQSSSRRKDLLRNATTNITSLEYKRNGYILRLNQQFSFALICIVFLFVGAPLGSIIRKGGYGYPLLFAILFYMLFIITTIMGEKLVRSQSMGPILAAWLANLIVFPVAIWLTFKALKDSKFEQFQTLRNIFSYFTQKKSL